MMRKQEKQALLPKLRFPEFREAGGWDADELGKVAVFVNEKIPVAQVALENYVSTENILQDYGGVARASKLPTTGAVTRFRPHDTLVSNIRPYLKKVWVADKEGGASNDVIVIRAKQRLLTQYFSFLLKNDAFIDYVMTGAKGVKMPRGDIGSMKEYPAFYPSKPEQQKIADCLASLDELITLEAQQLDTFKTHKKGLMQKLFPAEGETLPKLRFPEFRDAGEWHSVQLDELISTITPPKKIPTTDYLSEGLFPIIDQGQSDIAGWTNDSGSLIEVNQPLIVFGDHTCALKLIKRSFAQGADGIKIISGGKLVETDFLYQFLCSRPVVQEEYKRHFSILKTKIVTYPDRKSGEQQKIVAGLSSLDDLITAQTQKIAAFKTHKKGLMQQLFPVLDEVSA